MSIGKTDLGNGCFEFYATQGDVAWIAVFGSNGVEVKPVRRWQDTPGASSWAEGPFATEEEAWAYADSFTRY